MEFRKFRRIQITRIVLWWRNVIKYSLCWVEILEKEPSIANYLFWPQNESLFLVVEGPRRNRCIWLKLLIIGVLRFLDLKLWFVQGPCRSWNFLPSLFSRDLNWRTHVKCIRKVIIAVVSFVVRRKSGHRCLRILLNILVPSNQNRFVSYGFINLFNLPIR